MRFFLVAAIAAMILAGFLTAGSPDYAKNEKRDCHLPDIFLIL